MKNVICIALLLLVCQQTIKCQSQGQLNDLDLYLSRLAERDLFSGAILVAKGENILLQQAYGYASKEWKAENNLDTRFNLASMGKMFTAISIAKLVEQGRITLDTHLGEILPQLRNEPLKKKVTIKHLLSHRAGVGDIFTEGYLSSDKSKFRSVNDWDDLYLENGLTFEPGSAYRYSNGGFMLLGKIIEKVSGMSYEQFVQQEIFLPCNMINSGYYETDLINENLAEGYTYSTGNGFASSDRLRKNIYMHTVKGGPAGGGYSTVRDLFKFHKALYEHRLLSKETLNTFTQQSSRQGEEGYALGFQLTERFGEPVVGHTGGFQGISTIYEYYKKKDLTLIVLSNIDMGGMIAAERFARTLANQPLAQPDYSVKPGREYNMTLTPDAGIDAGLNMKMIVVNEHLMVDGLMRYVPLNENEFYDVIFEDIRIKALRNSETRELEGFAYKSPFESYNLKRLVGDELIGLTALPVSREYLTSYAAKYKVTDSDEEEIGSTLTLTTRKNGLFIDGRVPLLHFEKDKFFDETNQSFQVHFFRNAQGEVSGFELFLGQRRVVKAERE